MKSLPRSLRVAVTGTVAAIALIGAIGIPLAHAATRAPSPPSPIRVVHTAQGTEKIYDTRQLLAQPGVKTKVVTSKVVGGNVVRGITPNAYARRGNDQLTIVATLVFTYWNDHFVCAYGADSAEPIPNADMLMVGGLFYGSAQIDGFNIQTNGFQSYLGDETGCWNDGDAAQYEMTNAVTSDYPDGSVIDLSTLCSRLASLAASTRVCHILGFVAAYGYKFKLEPRASWTRLCCILRG
jgi:hypothetical protein